MGREQRARPSTLAVKDAAKRQDVDYLIGALSDQERLVRSAAAWHLGELGARRAVPDLVRRLNANDDLVRNSMVIALGKIGDPSAIPRLLEVAREDEAAMVRVQAIDSLTMLNDPRGREMLARLAIEPASLLAGASRYADAPLLRRQRRATRRWVSKWAAKRLRELHVADAAPILAAGVGSVGIVQRVRLTRVIRSLRQER